MSCTCGPLRLLTMLPPHTWPLTPRLTLKLSWLKPQPSSTPGLDSPAAPCRLSSISPRWPSACAAGTPLKPEPRPHPHPIARPWLRPGLSVPASLLLQKGQSWARTPSSLPPSTCPLPSPQPRWARPKCGGVVGEAGFRLNGNQSVGPCRSPLVPPPCGLGSTSVLSMQFICLCGRLAVWLGASACLCAVGVPVPGGGQQGPPPHMALALSMQEPQSPHFVCSSPVVLSQCACVCVCVFLGAVARVSLCLCGCAMV